MLHEKLKTGEAVDGVEWQVCDLHEPGKNVEIGNVDYECLQVYTLQQDYTVVLVRVDTNKGHTYFRVEQQLWGAKRPIKRS